jgi:hypothetical protein
MKKIGKFLLLTMITLLSFGASAQETTSEIQGLVSDGKTGLAGVNVVAVHQPTGTKYNTSTRADGRYNLPNLKIGGPYSITVSFVGFKSETENDVTLLLGQTHKSNFILEEANTTFGLGVNF